LIGTAFAMGSQGAAGQGAGGLTQFMPLLILLVIFYFLLIRPQQKRAKEHKEMVNNLKKGNRIVTSGGIHGTIASLDDTTVNVEIADKVTMKISRGNVAIILKDTSSSKK